MQTISIKKLCPKCTSADLEYRLDYGIDECPLCKYYEGSTD